MVDRYQSAIQVPVAQAARPDVSSGVIQFADATRRLAGNANTAVLQKIDARKRAVDAAALIKARQAYEAGIIGLEKETQQSVGPAGDGYVKTLEEKRKELWEQVNEGVPSTISQDGRLQLDAMRGEVDIGSTRRAVTWQADRETQYVGEAFDDQINAGSAAVVADPDSAMMFRESSLATLDSLSGMLTPEQETAARKRIDVVTALSAIEGYAVNDRPDEAYAILGKVKKGMTPEQQIEANNRIEAALDRKDVRRRQAQAAADEALRKVQAENAKNMDTLVFEGTLTKDWMLKNRDVLSETDYRRGLEHLGEVATGEVKSNAAVLAELTYRAAMGEDVSGAVRSQMSEGNLSRTDAASLMSRSGGNIEQPSWAKRGTEYINTALRPNDQLKDPTANYKLAGAINEWRDYVSRQKEAPSRDEAQKEMDAIVASYSLVTPAEFGVISLPASRVLGRRPQNKDDFNEWAEKLDKTPLSIEEERKERDLLKRWMSALSGQGAQ